MIDDIKDFFKDKETTHFKRTLEQSYESVYTYISLYIYRLHQKLKD